MKKIENLKKNNQDLLIYIILIIFAILISLQSSLSPINTGKEISMDVSVWTNIAKKMSQGKIMYKDFFDHKGPILYFVYYMGYTSGKNFGIWIIDVICNIVNVFMIYKTSKLILKDRKELLIIIGICMCFMCNICIENPCTESLALPFILISFYQFTKFILNNREFNRKESLGTGICFAIVLLLRPNIAALWVVYYIYIFIKLLKEKEIKYLLQIIGFSIIGALSIFLPIVLYLIINGAFIDFINTYLLFNLKYTNNKDVSIFLVIQQFIAYTNYIIVLVCALYIALINMKAKINKKEYESLKVSFIYFIFAFYLAVMPQRTYLHYLIPMLSTLIIPLVICLKYVKLGKKSNIVLIGIFLVYLLLSLYNLKTQTENYSSYASFYKELSQEVQKLTEKEDNVLILGNKAFIYLMSDREYKGKYLYQTPIANQSEGIAKEVIEEIKNDLPKLIVYSMNNWNSEEKQTFTNFEQEIKTILDENYSTDDNIIYVKK